MHLGSAGLGGAFCLACVAVSSEKARAAVAKDGNKLRNSLGGVPREQKMLKGHLPRVIYHRVYSNIRRETRQKS